MRLAAVKYQCSAVEDGLGELPDMVLFIIKRPKRWVSKIFVPTVEARLFTLTEGGVGDATLGDDVTAEKVAAAETYTVTGQKVCFGNLEQRFPRGLGRKTVVFVAAIVGNIVCGAADGHLVGRREDGMHPFVTQGIEVAEDVMRFIHKVNLRFSAQAV